MSRPFIRLSFFIALLFGWGSARAQMTVAALSHLIDSAEGLVETNVSGAMDLANTSFIDARELDFDEGIARCYIVVGRCYIQTADYEPAQKPLLIALKYAERSGNNGLVSDCYFYMGKSCFITGNTEQQLSWYNKSYAIRKALNDPKRLGDTYHAFGNAYLAMNNDSLAKKYFLLCRDIRAKLHDFKGLAAMYNNLAIIAGSENDPALYRSLMIQALHMNEQTGNMRYLATNHGNLGLSYLDEGKYDSAWYHCYKAYEIRRDNNFKDHLAGSYADLGHILFAQQKYIEALGYFKQGAALAEQINGREWMMGNYKALQETYAKLDSLEQSNRYKILAEELGKKHPDDKKLSKSIPLPPAFDLQEPRPPLHWGWWAAGSVVFIFFAGLFFYRRTNSK